LSQGRSYQITKKEDVLDAQMSKQRKPLKEGLKHAISSPEETANAINLENLQIALCLKELAVVKCR
jgi:hypothetical protein